MQQHDGKSFEAHEKKEMWVVLRGRVLNVSHFLSQHPGGVLAIFFAGKDASAEFDMIRPPDVIEKCAPDAVNGAIGTGGESSVRSQPQAFLLLRQLPRLSVEGHGRKITRKRTRTEATDWTDTER